MTRRRRTAAAETLFFLGEGAIIVGCWRLLVQVVYVGLVS